MSLDYAPGAGHPDDMLNRAELLTLLGIELNSRSIPHEIGYRHHTWTPRAIPTLTAGDYLGQVQVTVENGGAYRWLDRHGHAQHMPATDPAAVAARIIEDRAGTVSPPEPDPNTPAPPPPPAPLPRRGDRPTRPLHRPDTPPTG